MGDRLEWKGEYDRTLSKKDVRTMIITKYKKSIFSERF